MTDAQLNQIRNILNLDGWIIIQELIREPMEDVVEGRYEDIAMNVLAKNKAIAHINYILNKINGLREMPKSKPESFK